MSDAQKARLVHSLLSSWLLVANGIDTTEDVTWVIHGFGMVRVALLFLPIRVRVRGMLSVVIP